MAFSGKEEEKSPAFRHQLPISSFLLFLRFVCARSPPPLSIAVHLCLAGGAVVVKVLSSFQSWFTRGATCLVAI